MVAHGSAHVTKDIDLGYARDTANLAAIVRALQRAHPRLRVGADGELPFIWDERTLKAGLNFTLRTDYGDIDLLGETPGVGSFQELWDRAVEITVGGCRIRVASLDDLIAMKRAAGRPQDLHHLNELQALMTASAEANRES
jgi:hypothetical protein